MIKKDSRKADGVSYSIGEEIQRRLLKHGDNYNRWIFETIAPFLGERIVDAGCAIGNITKYFTNTQIVVGVDIEKSYLREAKARCKHLNYFITVSTDICNKKFINIKKYRIDTIVCLNVLEHLENDELAIQNFHKVLVDGGRLILYVPAFEILYGSLDRSDNHYRRYSRNTLVKLCRDMGFAIEKILYQNLLGVFGWFVNGRILKKPILPKRQLLMYDKFIPFIKVIEAQFTLPAGQSLFLVAKKPNKFN